jgi:predicted dienelactone hydrolase
MTHAPATATIVQRARGLLFLCCVWAFAAGAQPSLTVPPRVAPGKYPVACSNVAQDFARLLPGEDVQDYWEGVARADGTPRYVTSLLSEPAAAVNALVRVPANADLYGSFAGTTMPYVIIVCYPTAADNSRPDYPLPNGKSVPKMQRGGDAPWWPDPVTRFPILLFSHGYLGSPISNDYIDAVALLASYGYVVVAPLHGDGRFGSLKLEDLGDITYVALHLLDFLAMQAVRPLSLSVALDVILSDPRWANHVMAAEIGGFGASLGGQSFLLMAGAGLTTSLGLAWTKVETDARIKAAVGYVPYMGVPLFPAFGRDQRSLNDVTLPYLAIAGTADTTAPIFMTAQAVNALAGPRELVALTGVPHRFDAASAPDIFTWALTFLDAEIRGDPDARAQLAQMAHVAGGGDDNVLIPLNIPAAVNYGGLWWSSPAGSESGWGINLQHEDNIIFLTWFTYDVNGKPWWLAMTANLMSDGTYRGTLYETRGPPFSASSFDPAAVVAMPVGSGTLSFSDSDEGVFAYTIGSVSQMKPITREVFGRIPWCAFGTSFDPARATNYQGLWWNAPPGSEAGWGINLAHEGDIIFATWFTYDMAGVPLWLVATMPVDASGTYTGTLYRLTGPPYSAVPFDSTLVKVFSVGTARLTFASGVQALFEYTVDGLSQSKTITREVLRAPGTLCQ